MKEVFIESIALCFILNQTADSLWFTDAFCSLKIKSHLIYREEKKNLGYSEKSTENSLIKEIPEPLKSGNTTAYFIGLVHKLPEENTMIRDFAHIPLSQKKNR